MSRRNKKFESRYAGGSSEFYLDFNLEVPNLSDEFVQIARDRLRGLAEGHHIIAGAAVSLVNPLKAQTPYRYQVGIYTLHETPVPDSVGRNADPLAALRDALQKLEGRVLKVREKQRESPMPQTEKPRRWPSI
jgi:ribosome-associated translation inhibitor RaiA